MTGDRTGNHSEGDARDRRRDSAARPARSGAARTGSSSRSLFDDVSLSQVIAGAGAAATSMVLASRIGIAGSVIGAAISSAMTVVCSQLYRHFLTAGAEKLKGGAEALGMHDGSAGDRLAGERATEVTPERRAPETETTPSQGQADDRHGRMGTAPPERSARVAPVPLQMRAATERRSTQRRVAFFSVAIAIIAVALCAGAIVLTTQGKGLGHRTAPIFRPTDGQREKPEDDQPKMPRTEEEPKSNPAPRTDEGSGADGGGDQGSSSDPATDDSDGSGGGGGGNDSSGPDTGGDADASNDPDTSKSSGGAASKGSITGNFVDRSFGAQR